MPRLDETGLRKLARETGGSYRRMQIDDTDLEFLQAESLLYESDETLALDRTADAWEDQGYFFILALLPLALGLFRRGWILTLLPVLFLMQPEPASAGAWDDLWLTPDQQGQQALQRGDDETAAALFKNPEWAGTAAYRNKDYESAVTHFSDLNNANSEYNRGNALAQAGQLDEAIAAYQESLALQPDRTDAQENLALLEKLKEQQEQQEQIKSKNRISKISKIRRQQQDSRTADSRAAGSRSSRISKSSRNSRISRISKKQDRTVRLRMKRSLRTAKQASQRRPSLRNQKSLRSCHP